MGKMSKPGLVTAFAILLLYASTMNVAAQPTLEAQFLYTNAWTWTRTTAVSRHTGFASSFDATWIFNAKNDSLAANEGPRILWLFAVGAHAQFLSEGASAWLSDGSRYRAWNALGIGPKAAIGLELPGILLAKKQIAKKQTIFFGVAPIANFSRYTATTLYNAYWSWALKLSWEAEIAHNWAFGISLPVEIAWRSDGTSMISGIGIGLSYAF